MSNSERRRASARRRAWGRGPAILRFEPLEGRLLLTAGPAPDLVATALHAPSNMDWGESFHLTGTIQNQGNGTATASFRVDVYASTDPTASADDQYLGSVDLPTGLTAGASTNFDKEFQLPASALAGLKSPSFYLTLRVDSQNTVAESNEGNNVGFGVGSNATVVNITPRQTAALEATGFAVTPASATWGSLVTATVAVRNSGAGDAPATRARIVLTPYGEAPGGSNDVTIGSVDVPAVAALQDVVASKAISLPANPPTLLAASTQFTASVVLDADHQTTLATTTANKGLGIDGATLQIANGPAALTADQQSDLVVSSIQGPGQPLRWGQAFNVATTVQNTGKADLGPFTVRYFFVDDNAPNSPPLALADASLPGLKSGFAQDLVQTVRFPGKLPDRLTAGGVVSGHIVVWADPENAVNEASESNNSLQTAPLALNLIGTDGSTTPIPATGPVVVPTPIAPISPGPAQPAGTVPKIPSQPAETAQTARQALLIRRQQARLNQRTKIQQAREARLKTPIFPRVPKINHTLKVFGGGTARARQG
ncbi:MAG: CARDB domain-containing protein [Isosphaeraceae bacterium]